ncbi:sensor histidine kinase [Chitinophagaceae bacterium LWZ2-11]
MKELLSHIVNLGIDDDTPFDEIKKTRLTNLIIFPAIPYAATFVIINLLQHRYGLALFCSVFVMEGLFILYINYKKKYLFARAIFVFCSIILFTLSALFYHNGAEYHLILNVALIVILYKNKTFIAIASIANLVALFFIKTLPDNHLNVDPLPTWRVLANMFAPMIFLYISLQYFKEDNLAYHKKLEEANNKLKEQQTLLIQQTAELAVHNEQLQMLNQTKEKLFSIVAHDIRTPIAGLKGALELLNQEIITKESFKALSSDLSVQVDQLQHNIDNLLHWSYGQLTGIEVHAHRVALKPLVLDVISLLQQNLVKKSLRIEFTITDSSYIFADPDQLKIILRNLLSNAIKFSHPGHTITLSTKESNQNIAIEVKDTGVGMKPEMIEELFNSKLSSHRGTLNEKGTGLGLMLIKEFIDKNNGTIDVKSELGKGTVFTVTLPAVNNLTIAEKQSHARA